MKKQSLILLGLIVLLFNAVKAQKTDTIRAKATYAFSHIQDTLNRNKPFTQEMVLLLTNQSSCYLSLDKINFDIQRRKDLAEQMKNSVPGKMNFKVGTDPKKTIQEELYLYTGEKKMIIKKRLINNYLIEESFPEINWNLTADTSTIAGLKCQKATTHFMGRDYTAWFCPDLPFQSGPWKLNGLPGLIVSARDAKNEVIFDFLGFESIKHNGQTKLNEEVESGGMLTIKGLTNAALLNSPVLYLPKEAIKTSEKEYQKLAEAMKKDPEGFISSSMPGTSFKITNSIKNPVRQETINNPIEILEVK
ncbi:GLPGLI family protein [Pedobacter gandavensis]|uniref:GLPGLI family protein n=1 Tax=Pedobacter gandavensis TaxID=2679963 RepID=UPI0029319AE5|nr:GLPGLI family protein [Pedobacter gandavensis]